eukprot:gb/GFBE01046126.1/.p1 GENE.gb/GFBE01046126.1/~~gb/GFBE01046126.1/.p1  ORF type:complete len:751 (+),score=279.69 gb/GFBE01046126.1/:1-2253(+)
MRAFLAAALVAGFADVSSAASLRRSASSRYGKADVDPSGKSIPEQDLVDMLTTLNEVVVGLKKEETSFKALADARQKACETNEKNLMKSIKDGNSTLQTAQNQLAAAMAEVDSIQGGIDSVKAEIATAEGEMKELQKQLSNLRADRQAALERDSGYTQEVKAILKKAEERIDQVWTRSGAHEVSLSDEAEDVSEAGTGLVLDSAAESQVSELKQLEDSFALPAGFLQLASVDESEFSVAHEGRHDLTSKAAEDPAAAAAADGKEALEADSKDMYAAAKKAREEFQLEEMRLMELIKEKQNVLKPLDESLLDQQPELADQLRKISEANRTVVISTKGLKRDGQVLEKLNEKCAMLVKAKEVEAEKRPQASQQLTIAISFLKTIASVNGYELPPGAQGVALLETESASHVSFLQLESSGSSDLSEAIRSTLRNMESLDGGDFKTAAYSADPASTAMLQGIASAAGATSSSEGSEAAGDALKNVKEMISNLIASLREEQNEEKEKQAFCEEQRQKQAAEAKKVKESFETAEQAKRWSENAVLDLEAAVGFLKIETGRLEKASASSKEDLDAEVSRITAEAENHEASKGVATKAREVLMTYCGRAKDEDGKELDAVQAESAASAGNCREADSALRRANTYITEIDQYLAGYIVEFQNVTAAHKADIDATLKLAKAGLFQAESDLNRRKDELAQNAEDLLSAQGNIKLAQEANDALSTDCGPKVHKLEDTIARRKEEIAQLKNAVKVLDGEVLGR